VVYFLAETPGSGTNSHSLWKYIYITDDGSGGGGMRERGITIPQNL
jgi:hypothetical protein